MNLSSFTLYLIAINILGFILSFINSLLCKHAARFQLGKVLAVGSVLGGSLGILLFILLFDRKSVKENMMSRVFVLCVFVIQLLLFLVARGHFSDHITFAFWTFFAQHRLLSLYLGIMNVVTFAAFALDKRAAIKHKARIRIVTLLALSFIGGSIGGICAMYCFHHKTKKDYFTVGMPLILFMQILLLFYAMNAAW